MRPAGGDDAWGVDFINRFNRGLPHNSSRRPDISGSIESCLKYAAFGFPLGRPLVSMTDGQKR